MLEQESQAHAPQATRTHDAPQTHTTNKQTTRKRLVLGTFQAIPQIRTDSRTLAPRCSGSHILHSSRIRRSSGPLPVGGHDIPYPTPSSGSLGQGCAHQLRARREPGTTLFIPLGHPRCSRPVEVENKPSHLPCSCRIVSNCVALHVATSNIEAGTPTQYLNREMEALLEHCASVSRRYMLGRAQGNSPSTGQVWHYIPLHPTLR
jgi:hypothetical protein